MAFGVFDVKMQFLSRKKPIFCDFWPFLVIFEFELMPAGASLWFIHTFEGSEIRWSRFSDN